MSMVVSFKNLVLKIAVKMKQASMYVSTILLGEIYFTTTFFFLSRETDLKEIIRISNRRRNPVSSF